jgi:transitional endoplasmic reticulum ATPase
LALALCGLQRLRVYLLTPRPDPQYPLVGDLQAWEALAWPVLQHCAWSTAMLAIITCFATPGIEFTGALASAVATGVVTAFLLVYIMFMPTGGRRIPSAEELQRWQQRQQRPTSAATAPAQDADYPVPVELEYPSGGFATIHGMGDTKERLLRAAQEILQHESPSRGEQPRNGILLHGAPGNGKTVFAEALAAQLGVPLVRLTHGLIASKWIGESPRLVNRCFEFACTHAPCVLFLDEVDSLLRSREDAIHAEDRKLTNNLLTEIVGVRRHAVVLVAATNHLARLDAAAIREGRFDFKIEVPAPDEEARVGLLRAGAAKYASGFEVDEATLQATAARWNGFAVSRLLAVCQALPGVMPPQVRSVGYGQWLAALRSINAGQGRVPQHAKRLSELILPAQTRAPLALLAARMRDGVETEAFGGSLPRGVLLHGAPGTGKTAGAQALALECGWAFVAVVGANLLSRPEELPKLFERAEDLRPTIVFIDEADDLLRDRAISMRPELANKLLALMDGAREPVKDVVVLAATNHLAAVDGAFLRAGRFTEKVWFAMPSAEEISAYVEHWLHARAPRVDSALDTREIARCFEGSTIADAGGLLQYALDHAIGRTGVQGRATQEVCLEEEDLLAAWNSLMGADRPSSRP